MPTTKKTAKKVIKKATKKAAKKVVKKVTKKTTKKVAKKAPAKKATKPAKATKKTAKKSTKRALVSASNQQSFWVTNGQILNNLVALSDALKGMKKEVYLYHADGWQNDFAQWVEVVLNDTACAKELRKAKSPTSARTVVVRHLKFYKV